VLFTIGMVSHLRPSMCRKVDMNEEISGAVNFKIIFMVPQGLL
jgi:hypothetical protein